VADPRIMNAQLEPLLGEWSIAMVTPVQEPPDELPDLGARATFEWMGEKAFVLQRWSVPIPEAPDGLAVIGWDEGRDRFLMHYFDDRSVARVYDMGFEARAWTLERSRQDFSAFEFSQRFTGTFSPDGKQIEGTWEIANDHKTWEKDFDLIYTRLG
jgi:hypothetical protein